VNSPDDEYIASPNETEVAIEESFIALRGGSEIRVITAPGNMFGNAHHPTSTGAPDQIIRIGSQ
jgi:hypothetical protein